MDEELSEMYFNKYPNLIESREEGYIWADLEIKGMAQRTDYAIVTKWLIKSKRYNGFYILGL